MVYQIIVVSADIFDGTVMSRAPDHVADSEIDVENDDTNTYGPSQYYTYIF